MLEFNNVNKKYDNLIVLKNISFKIKDGESFAIAGPNGSGKTTILKSLLGLVKIESGLIKFNGKDITSDHLYKENIGYMPQIGRYPENITAKEVFSLIGSFRKIDKNKCKNLIDTFELGAHLNKQMRSLSGGTRQKVSAIMTLMSDPELYILDEPTSGLDPVSAAKFKELINTERERGKTIILVSHIINEIDEMTENLLYLVDGNIIINQDIDNLIHITSTNKIDQAILKYLGKHHETSKHLEYNKIPA